MFALCLECQMWNNRAFNPLDIVLAARRLDSLKHGDKTDRVVGASTLLSLCYNLNDIRHLALVPIRVGISSDMSYKLHLAVFWAQVCTNEYAHLNLFQGRRLRIDEMQDGERRRRVNTASHFIRFVPRTLILPF